MGNFQSPDEPGAPPGVGVYGIGMGGRACPSAVTVTCWEPFANVVTDAVKVVAVNSKEPNAAPVATSIT